jgi:hypothetical protein
MDVTNGMIFTHSDGDKVSVNYDDFCKIITGIIVKYGNTDVEEANEMVKKSFLYNDPPTTYEDICFLTQELDYHWAMTIAYGGGYWQKGIGVKSDLPEDFFDWYNKYLKDNELEFGWYQYS